jgi:hypothetical protein
LNELRAELQLLVPSKELPDVLLELSPPVIPDLQVDVQQETVAMEEVVVHSMLPSDNISISYQNSLLELDSVPSSMSPNHMNPGVALESSEGMFPCEPAITDNRKEKNQGVTKSVKRPVIVIIDDEESIEAVLSSSEIGNQKKFGVSKSVAKMRKVSDSTEDSKVERSAVAECKPKKKRSKKGVAIPEDDTLPSFAKGTEEFLAVTCAFSASGSEQPKKKRLKRTAQTSPAIFGGTEPSSLKITKLAEEPSLTELVEKENKKRVKKCAPKLAVVESGASSSAIEVLRAVVSPLPARKRKEKTSVLEDLSQLFEGTADCPAAASAPAVALGGKTKIQRVIKSVAGRGIVGDGGRSPPVEQSEHFSEEISQPQHEKKKGKNLKTPADKPVIAGKQFPSPISSIPSDTFPSEDESEISSSLENPTKKNPVFLRATKVRNDMYPEYEILQNKEHDAAADLVDTPEKSVIKNKLARLRAKLLSP